MANAWNEDQTLYFWKLVPHGLALWWFLSFLNLESSDFLNLGSVHTWNHLRPGSDSKGNMQCGRNLCVGGFMEGPSGNNASKEMRETGLRRVRSWTAIEVYQNSQPVQWEALELGWPFRVAGLKQRGLDFNILCMDQSLGQVFSREG